MRTIAFNECRDDRNGVTWEPRVQISLRSLNRPNEGSVLLAHICKAVIMTWPASFEL